MMDRKKFIAVLGIGGVGIGGLILSASRLGGSLPKKIEPSVELEDDGRVYELGDWVRRDGDNLVFTINGKPLETVKNVRWEKIK